MSRRSAFRLAGDLYRRERSKSSALPIFAIVGMVCLVIAWGMSAQDPYWKLFGVSTQPAPVYDSTATEAVARAYLPPGPANPETPAVSPGAMTEAPAHSELVRAAETVRVPEPVPVEIPPLKDAAELETEIAQPNTDAPSPGYVEPAALLASAGPVLSLDHDAAGAGLTPFAAPEAPEQPRLVASPETEEALALTRSERIDVQRRLALAGFDPRGFDGVFGPNTRSAISDFQAAWGFPVTGYMEESVHADLNRRTDAAYQAMQRRAATAVAEAPLPTAREQEAEIAEKKCERRENGRIIPGQSLGCDLAGFAQQFATLGRTVIGDGDDADESSAGPAPAFKGYVRDR